MTDETFTLADFHVGQRIEIHPASDLWMRGIRYGTVTRIGKRTVFFREDRTAAICRVFPHNVIRIIITGH